MDGRTWERAHMMMTTRYRREIDYVTRPQLARLSRLVFSNRVLHYASALRGTRQYWFRQRCRLVSMIDTLGLPTIFFTHSAADLQWSELARLMCPEVPESSASRSRALNDNPAIPDWFFHERIVRYIEAFYIHVLGVTDFWLRFEWPSRSWFSLAAKCTRC